MADKMSDDEFKSALDRMISAARDDETNSTREGLYKSYLGEPTEKDSKLSGSKFVSSDVADFIESLLPDILEPFVSGDDVMEFSAVGAEDEAAAKQETAVVRHLFWDKNPGFSNLYQFAKEGLMQQNSYMEHGWVDKERSVVEKYEDLTMDELAAVYESLGDYDSVEVIEQSGGEVDPETGVGAPVDVSFRCVKTTKEYVIECFPQEEFYITSQWNKIGLDGVPCCGRRRAMSHTELEAMGFDPDSFIDEDEEGDDTQTQERFSTKDYDSYDSEGEGEEVTVYKSFVRMDREGDGVEKLLLVWSTQGGKNILRWKDGGDAVEEVDRVNIVGWTPYIMPHRHVGRSGAEQVDDIQNVKTVLFRNTLDNVYRTAHNRPIVDTNLTDKNTWADLMDPKPGAPIRARAGGVTYTPVQSVAAITLPLIDNFNEVKEQRVGQTRYNQGLDANSLNKTASGIAQIQAAGSKRSKLVARTLAETGLRDLFVGIHSDLRQGPVKEIAIKLNGEWVDVNPRTWRERTDMTIEVGAGSSDKAERQAFLQLTLQQQQQALASGMPGVTPQHLHNTYSDLAKTYGIKSIDNYWTPPDRMPAPPPQPDQPDPMLLLAQQQLELEKLKAQISAQNDQQKLDLERFKAESKAASDMAESQRKDIATASDIQTAQEAQDLAENKAVMQDDLERDKLAVSSLPPVDYSEVTQ